MCDDAFLVLDPSYRTAVNLTPESMRYSAAIVANLAGAIQATEILFALTSLKDCGASVSLHYTICYSFEITQALRGLQENVKS
ncbi:uncharacterized protein AtWU_01819 [Aspergillus tubingensis]|uniref:uncharacterized protein n=1 Tax=Aspergillus tubingensis TaxID=5068 RepID=UPI0015790714|nr:uncharacterized protein AtWU_01819 [Aspergillus tubingensis]GFN12022.1 hypothetical protein AtWU_01819 [Aspergillus tubingensis]